MVSVKEGMKKAALNGLLFLCLLLSFLSAGGKGVFWMEQRRRKINKNRRNGQYHLPADIDRLYMLRKKTQPEANNDKILISVKEACELTGLSEKTMRSLMNENCFMVRIGRRTLIDKKKFQKWIDRQS